MMRAVQSHWALWPGGCVSSASQTRRRQYTMSTTLVRVDNAFSHYIVLAVPASFPEVIHGATSSSINCSPDCVWSRNCKWFGVTV